MLDAVREDFFFAFLPNYPRDEGPSSSLSCVCLLLILRLGFDGSISLKNRSFLSDAVRIVSGARAA